MIAVDDHDEIIKKCRRVIYTWLEKGRKEAEKILGSDEIIRNLAKNNYVSDDGSELIVEEFTDMPMTLMVLCGADYVKRVEYYT